jgi:tRNA(Ile)-lysidine synthase
MIATVAKTVDARFPQLRGARVLVAASGGADSTALALALSELGCRIELAHVHHGIRGAAADADERFVANLAETLGAPISCGRFDVPAQARATGESLEMAARRVRRAFLAETAAREKIRYVATGHTADDQAETILMRIARGTGIGGLAGIAHCAKEGRLAWVRPLRDVWRQDVVAYLRGRGQAWREDESNANDFALRNRVRHEILPLIERRLNPQAREALVRLGEIAAAEDEVMADLARTAKPSANLPRALRRRLAMAALRREGADPQQVDFAAVEGYSPQKSGTSTAWKKFSMLWKNSPESFHGVEKVFHSVENIFHSVEVPDFLRGLRVEPAKGYGKSRDEVWLSAAAVAGRDLTFRSWRAGDRMKPLGMAGSKKLSDVFTDLKVPRAERNRWVVVECGGEIAALAGWRVARGFAVESMVAASLRIRPAPPGKRI